MYLLTGFEEETITKEKSTRFPKGLYTVYWVTNTGVG